MDAVVLGWYGWLSSLAQSPVFALRALADRTRLALSFAFCPTLFWLFFGLTVPLATKSTGAWAFPGLFALGASLHDTLVYWFL